MDEFARIATFFAPLSGPEGLGLIDDAALWTVEPGAQVVLSKDMLVEGVHVPRGAAPQVFAQRALRTNLSDLAAMGATPKGYLLGLGLPSSIDDAWLRAFVQALQSDQEYFGLSLWGGDSVRTAGDITVSITAIGMIAQGQAALQRNGAKAGDALFVSGHIGRAAAGLAMALGGVTSGQEIWRQAFDAPSPRLALSTALGALASACADVSDGLIADAGHIAKASGLQAYIELAALPVDDDLPLTRLEAATAGDDYELVFTVPADKKGALFTLSERLGLKITCIGHMAKPGPGGAGPFALVYDAQGALVPVPKAGWRHNE